MTVNKYMLGMRDMIEQRFSPKDRKLKMSEWLHKTKIQGRPFSTAKYPFQEALIDDDHVRSCTVKPSQVGVSEIYQRVALAMLRRNPHRKLIYAYPDDLMRQKNVQTRVHPIADQDVFFEEGERKPTRSIDLVQIGSSWLYMTGSKVGDATSTDADAVFLDEYDLHDMKIASLFQSRMQNSDWKIQRKFSTPTWANFGIDGEFRDSDQTSYMIRCDSCNRWQFPMFTPDFIHIPGLPSDFNDLTTIDFAQAEHFRLDLRASYVCCHHCRSKLDLGRTDNRAWVTKHPSRTHMLRGWKINPFSAATRPPVDLFKELFDYQKNNNLKGFKNSSLGEPEDTGANRLQEADIRACLGTRSVPAVDVDAPTWLGIDMGHQCHMLVGQGSTAQNMRVVRALKVPIKQLATKVEEMLKTYRVVGGACDRHPESLAADQLRVLSGGRIIPCEYRGQKELNLVKDPLDPNTVTHAQINRTQIIDSAAEQIRKKHIIFNGFEDQSEEIVDHYRNMVRTENPEKEAVWEKLSEQDHFFHAGAFLNAAMKIKNFQEATGEHQGTVVGIVGVDMPGYNGSLVGNTTPKQKSQWQPRPISYLF